MRVCRRATALWSSLTIAGAALQGAELNASRITAATITVAGHDPLGRLRRTDLRQPALQHRDDHTPKKPLTTEPRPPIRLVPPITTAAIADSSRPMPLFGSADSR